MSENQSVSTFVIGLLACIFFWGCVILFIEYKRATVAYEQLNTELIICNSYLEDTCTAIDSGKDNFRVSCKDMMDANDRGKGR